MLLQKTIRQQVEVDGIGLHTGKKAKLRFKPAMPNTGIVFVRADVKGPTSFVRVHSDQVVDTRLATTIGDDHFRISTVEHCLCAMAALRIDNLVIELEGPEIPIKDGSSLHFLDALKKVGLIEQSWPRQYWVVHQPVKVMQGDKWGEVLPYHGLRLTVTIDFPHPAIGHQSMDIDINENSFSQDIAGARTFGFLKDVEALQAQGLARGGSLENAIVLDDTKILNPEGLRWPDEFVRHKCLDALGDLSLLGYPLMGHVRLHKAGHDLLHQLVQQIRESSERSKLQQISFDVSG